MTDTHRWRRVEELCHAALDREANERSAFLTAACGDDVALRREVEALLAHEPEAAAFLSRPVAAVAADVMSGISRASLVGRRIGAYEVLSQLGVGGMGEVYRARDTLLGREVAIKVLPPAFVADRERLARFEREARVLAALNHPHIGAIYGVEPFEGARALILELVEGETLAERLATRSRRTSQASGLPVAEALHIARQIAEALEAAHEKGVVHRDLKPANIKITPQGVVKVLDFGLAKAVDPDAAGRDHDGSPAPSGGTKTGLILGTPGYMSPEQARGGPIDKRADIWAFGCVLYEMLTGRNPFDAGTASEAIAKILEREPEWGALPTMVPDAIRRLLKRCLRKDPSERLRDIADARFEIADVMSAPETSATAGTSRWRWMALAAAAGAIGASVLLVAVLRTRPSTSGGLLEFRIDLADNAAFGIAVSPDGRRVAIGVCCGGPQIWMHSFDSGKTLPVPGTEGGGAPFWSPDSSEMGFFAHRQFMRVDAAGGPPVVICEAGAYPAGSWNAHGDILFSSDLSMFRVSASGGARAHLNLTDGEGVTAARTTPVFLSDGRHFIYHLQGAHGNAVRVGSLDSTETKRLVDSDYPATFAPPSHLIFLRGTALMTATIDPIAFELKGPASLVAPDVAPGYLGGPGRLSLFSASTTGVLAFVPTRGGGLGRLTWVDRGGKVTSAIEPPPGGGEYLNPAISPNGELVAANHMDPQTGNWDVWVVDVAGHVSSRLTSDSARDSDPVWSPDGKEIAFASNRSGKTGLYRKPADGSGPEVPVAAIDGPVVDLVPNDWSRDGGYLIYTLETPKLGLSIWKAPVSGTGQPVQLLQGASVVYGARLSPDGQWIAYASFETGPTESYVQRLAGGDKRQISHGGGSHPRWTAEGRELVYWAFPGGVAGIDLETSGPHLHIGSLKALIATPILTLIDSRPHYDVTRDGQHFLLRQSAGGQPPAITVMVNWTDTLKK